MQNTIDTLKYVRAFSGETIVIKLGGAALQDEHLVSMICDDLSLIRSVGVKVVLVHGGGPSINDELKIHGIEWSFLNGQRITTPDMMDIVEMVLCGKVNRRIVRTINKTGVKAIGLSGSDASMLLCVPSSKQLGQVGKVETVDPTLIRSLIEPKTDSPESGVIPVIAPVGMGRDGNAFNVNADWASTRIAEALGVKKLIFLTDQEGILDENKKLIAELDAGELEQLIEREVVTGGMRAKVETILHALKHGVTHVHVLNAKKPHALIEELFTASGSGTLCRLRSRGNSR